MTAWVSNTISHDIPSGGDFATAAISGAIDRSDQRKRTTHDRPHHPLEDGVLRLPGFIRHALALFEVAAGAKRLFAAAGQDHRAQTF